MKPWMPSSVCAQTIAMCARLPLVIHILAPLMTQSPPSFFALVFMLAGSEPPCGSVRPKQPMISPAAMPRQVLLLLLFAAVGEDRVHAQRALHRGEAAQAGIAALQLLADQAVADAVHAGAAVFLGNGRAEQAERRRSPESAPSGSAPWSKQSPMIGSTFSSTKRPTVSCTMRSSSVSSERTS